MSRREYGNFTEVQAQLIPDTKSGTPGASAIKVKGVITWVVAADALKAEVRLYDRLLSVPQPDTTEKDFLEELNSSTSERSLLFKRMPMSCSNTAVT